MVNVLKKRKTKQKTNNSIPSKAILQKCRNTVLLNCNKKSYYSSIPPSVYPYLKDMSARVLYYKQRQLPS